MPFRLGDIVLFGFFALLLHVMFHRCPRDKGDSRTSKILKDDVRVASVVEVTSASATEAPIATLDKEIKSTSEPTGRLVKVGGCGTLFECVEYRCDERYETHVCRIDAKGQRISPTCVYREPFDQVKDSFTTVAA